MSLYDKASLVQIPSGYKSGTLYSVLPANGNGDFTHTRASSATRVNKDGLIESVASGVPRLDYPLIDGVVQSCPALLLEPSRLNRVTYSESFDDVSWTKTASTITANNGISPDGSQNADEITEDTSTSTHRVSKSIVVSGTGVTYTQSVFAKSGNGTRYLRMFRGSGTYNFGVFDLNNGTIYSSGGSNLISANIENYGNGWYRCSITFTTQFINISTYFGMQNGSSDSYLGDGTSSIYVWGAQLEEGSYPTSYIKTASIQVTRSADVCNGAGTSAEFNDSEGVLFAEIAALADDSQFKAIAISDGTSSGDDNRVNIAYLNSNLYANVRVGNVYQFNENTTVNVNLKNKVALKYKSSDFAVWFNGFEILNQSGSGTTFPNGTLSELAFDDGQGSSGYLGKTKQLMTFKTALTDSELEQITSWTSFSEMAKGQLYTIE